MDVNYSKVAKYPGLGNGLAASRDFEDGEEIMGVNEPYLIIIEKKALQEVSFFMVWLVQCSGKLIVGGCLV